MQKYIVRSIGWVFDDDWHNYDGEHDVEGIYATEIEAIKRVDYLNYIYFLGNIDKGRPFQLNYNYSSNGEEFLNRDLLVDLIAKHLGIKKELLFKEGRFTRSYEENYLSKLSEKQVKDILLTLKLSFFTYVEFKFDNYHLYKFKRNPDIWHKQFESSLESNPHYYYYFFDYRDSDKIRLVNTKLECYYYAANHDDDSITWQLSSEKMILGTIEELSATPELLIQVIKNSPNISINNINQSIVFSKEVTPQEIMSLDATLTKPILIIEKVPIDELPLFDVTKTYTFKEVKRKYGL